MERCGICDCEVDDFMTHQSSPGHQRRLADEGLQALLRFQNIARHRIVRDPAQIAAADQAVAKYKEELNRAESQVSAAGS